LIGHHNDSAVSLVEVNSETDFVAQNDRFKQFIKDIAQDAAESMPSSLDALLTRKYSKDASVSIDEFRALTVRRAKIRSEHPCGNA
jgi:elongation factor Ts